MLEPPPNDFIRRKMQLRAALGPLPGLSDREHDKLAEWMISVVESADKLRGTHDRLLSSPHTREELSELLVGFGLTLDDLYGPASLIMDTLFEVGHRLRGEDEDGEDEDGED